MTQENRYEPPKADVVDVANDDEGQLASRGARFGAALVDGVLALVIMVPAMYSAGVWEDAMSGKEMSLETKLGFGVLGLALTVVLHGYLLHRYGQTIGKRLVGTRVVSVDESRILPLWKIVVMRYLPITVASQIPGVGPLLSLVNPLFIFRGDRRCLHDLIAGTKVINAAAPWKGLTDSNDAV